MKDISSPVLLTAKFEMLKVPAQGNLNVFRTTILANWLRDTWPFLNLFVSNLKIGDNINPQKHFTKFFPPLPLNNVEVQKLYKISGMCWTLDSQHCLGGGEGRGRRYY